VKSGILRFGSGPNDPSDLSRMPPGTPTSSQPVNGGPLRPLPAGSMAPSSAPHGTPESAHQPPSNYSIPQQQTNTSGISNIGSIQMTNLNKPQNYSGKQKKNRKSPVPDYENTSTNRSEDLQSPAYSDISEDSTPVVDSEMSGKYICIEINFLELYRNIKKNNFR